VNFYKYHALGNDYIVIDPEETRIELNPAAVRLICHRHLGIGSDGILYGPIPDAERFTLRILNPDGSEAEKSGNGIRIFSRYLVEAGYVSEKAFTLHTPGGAVAVEVLNEDASLIKADMGSVTFESSEIPVRGELREVVDETLRVGNISHKVTCLSIGNPHCVIPLDEISEEYARVIGPRIENHPMFPNRINMQLLRVIDRDTIEIEIWERGAGYTLASGSSSCAAASAAYRLGMVDNRITVHMPGGAMEIEIDENKHVHMTGPVSSVGEGNFSGELWNKLGEL
jgi:diaminopimelate epimerase